MDSSDFKENYFKKGTVPSLAVVKEKLKKMCGGPDGLRMCVLYFLASVLGGKAKTGNGAPSVYPFFFRIVEDLDVCRTFPWGRYSFYVNLKKIDHTLRHFNGVVETDSWTFLGFVTPLELLPFDMILDEDQALDYSPTVAITRLSDLIDCGTK
ncbi:uncharacterized protein LOC112082135 [Eutrema salsugineum]|uniref:uncharacterized protein LOC112082135 n=1 Tax=Eutrema salsugineum TaxID=72664 RepID=UPI000CED6B0E|nr:uncharacterized protein LOC112082135 [Eutrema salsugineum]